MVIFFLLKNYFINIFYFYFYFLFFIFLRLVEKKQPKLLLQIWCYKTGESKKSIVDINTVLHYHVSIFYIFFIFIFYFM